MTIDPLIGQTFGQYELQDRLGWGGMATVYRALQPNLGRAVAVKVLPLAHLPDPTLPERFRREARLAANLLHPNIVPVYDFGEWQGYLYIVMALVAGGTLKDRLQGPLPVESAVRLVDQVADALGYAHGQGIFHRDVKPANILLAAGDWAMLSDFGIAHALGETTRLTGPSGTIGTPAYMAPEQWLGGEVDGRADLYSLGIVLYELLAGSPPFTAATAQGLMHQHLEMSVPPLVARRGDLPPGLDEVLQIALAKEPDNRFRHAAELKAALEAATRPDQPAGFAAGATAALGLGPAATHHDLGQTVRVPLLLPPATTPGAEPRPRTGGGVPLGLAALVLVLVLVLAGGLGYILAGGRLGLSGGQAPTPTAGSAAAAPTSAPTPQPVSPTPLTVQPASPTLPPAPSPTVVQPTAVPKVVAEPSPSPIPPTATPPPPPTATARPPAASPPAPSPTARPAPAQPTAPAKVPPSPSPSADPRLGIVERHVADYFAALNAGDYARAQAACCTPAWRAKYPLDEWQKNFDGVTDLRFSTPFRYTAVEADRIVAEVDYSFANSSGARRFFTLRWTFVPVGADWLADDAVAFAQR